MTAQDIASLIKEPGRSGQIAPEELSALAEKYPYTQIFSLLYLQSLGKRNDLRFDEELMRHSYRITDRARLYRLIHDFQTVPAQADEVEAQSEELQPVPEANEPVARRDEKPEELVLDTLPNVEIHPEEPDESPTLTDAHENVQASALILPQESATSGDEVPVTEEINREETAEEEETPVTEPEEATADPLDQLILHYAATASYRLEDLTPEEIEEMERRKEEKQAKKPFVEIQEEILPPRIDVEPKQSFTSWLSTNRNALPEDKEEQKAVRSVVGEFKSFDPSEELFGEVEKPKQEFFSPARKAKESLREDDLPVSETLAKIYAMQGNYPKAIRAYEQLSLIYPEKKTFFATLIADLEQKLNLK